MSHTQHHLKLYVQTPEIVCGPTALAMLLSAYGRDVTPSEVEEQASRFKPPGAPGLISQELAAYCLSLGYEIKFWSFDGRILDYSWRDLQCSELASKIEALCDYHESQGPKNETQLRYAKSYLAFLKAGGSLHIAPFVTSELILSQLRRGPVKAAVAFNVLASEGKRNSKGVLDPFTGGFGTHSIVIYGYDEAMGFLIADPAVGRGRVTVSRENLLAAISTAQTEDDNALFYIAGDSAPTTAG